jgi:hypothetical protein
VRFPVVSIFAIPSVSHSSCCAVLVSLGVRGRTYESTQKDAASPGADLEDMQSLLYHVETGDAYSQTGNLGMALKKYAAVQKVSSVCMLSALVLMASPYTDFRRGL